MSSNPDHIKNLHKLKALGFDVEEQLKDTFESWGYDEQVYLMKGIIPEITNLVEQNKALRAALVDVLVEYQGVDGCKVLIKQCEKALEQAK
ncbi:MAG: hypothetical protein V7765_21825 [Oleispira sp.]